VIREVMPPTLLGLLLFTFILLLKDIPTLLGTLISRNADAQTILRVFVNLLPSIFAVTIPMAFLLGVLISFGRMASDSEIVAMRASGLGPGRLLRPVLALSVMTGLLSFYVNAVALPRSNQAFREIFYTLIVAGARTRVQPRVFNTDLVPGGRVVLYVSDISAETAEWHDVFIYDTQNPRQPRAILARRGHLLVNKALRRVEIHLEDGVLHSFDPVRPESYEEQRFRAGDFPLSFEDLFPKVNLSKGDREMTLGELKERADTLRAAGPKGVAEARRYDVEWHKKFSLPAACLVFGILGVGLSLGSKKEARSGAFALSIAVIFVYYVFIRLGEQLGDAGRIHPLLAMWSANLALGSIAVALIVMNQREAAFDPLDAARYTAWIPRVRKTRGAEPTRGRLPAGPRKVAVVVRVPRLSIPFPSILDRYVARQYISHLILVMAAFWSIFILVEFMDLIDDVGQNKVKGRYVVHYFAYKSPSIVHLVAPVGVLVATLTTFGIMSRRNEITAMKAGGISIYRATFAAVALGAAASGVLFGMTEYLLPETNRIAQSDFNVIKGRPPETSGYLDRHWILGTDGRFFNYEYFEDRGGHITLYGLSVFDVEVREWALRNRLYAARAIWNGVSYDLERGWRRYMSGGEGGAAERFRLFDQARTREIEEPSYFKREVRESDTMRFAELGEHIRSLEVLGLDVVKLKVQLQRKLAAPVVAVVMVLLGIPFSFIVGRKGALYGIGMSILIAIVYWACIGSFEAFGNSAVLPPLLAAWAPNLIFGATSLYLMLRLET
jgi:LPS export ABC transporter permease LptG/LPS export ABC transporter permease LptF